MATMATMCLILTSTSALSLAPLRSSGFQVIPDFFASSEVKALKEDVSILHSEGRFAVAGVGEANTNRVAEDVRRCEQCFLFPRVKHGSGGHQPGRKLLYDTLSTLQANIQEETGQALDGLLTEGLYAQYPSGGYYRRHVDSVPGTPQEIRKFSYLLYCNEAWQPSDGGCLRIHTDGGGETAPAGAPSSFVDIEPRAGTLVVFRSDVPHEVLDTSAPRLAVAGWFNAPQGGSNERRTLIAALSGALVIGGAIKFTAGLFDAGAH